MPFAAIASFTILKAIFLIASLIYVFIKYDKKRYFSSDVILVFFILITQLFHCLVLGDINSLKSYWLGTSLVLLIFSLCKMTYREFMIPFALGLILSVIWESLAFDWSKMIYLRFSGKMLDPNFFAFFLLSTGLLASSYFKRFAVYFVALLSLSKTALIYVFFQEGRRILNLRNLIVFLVLGTVLFDFWSERLMQSWVLSDHDLKLYLENSSRYHRRYLFGVIPYEAFSLRVGLWIHAINYSLSVFPIGVGFGNYLKYFMDYIIPGVLPVPMHPHNTYLHLIVDYGILGLVYSFVLLKWLFRIPSRYMRILLIVFSSTLTFISTPLFYILLLLDYEDLRR